MDAKLSKLYSMCRYIVKVQQAGCRQNKGDVVHKLMFTHEPSAGYKGHQRTMTKAYLQIMTNLEQIYASRGGCNLIT